MKRSSLLVVVAIFCTATAFFTAAQEPEPAHAQDGFAMQKLQSIFISPLANAPFSATVETGWTRRLEDGNAVTVGNHRLVARDRAGRVFEERRWFVPTGIKRESRLSNLQYSDPAKHEMEDCVPARQVCEIRTYAAVANEPLAPVGKQPDGGMLTRSSLGSSQMEGVDVVGTLETITIPGGVLGGDKPVAITKEFWYSPRLGVNLLVKRIDPRSGTQIFAVKDVHLGEPERQQFEPPAGYRMVDVRAAASVPADAR